MNLKLLSFEPSTTRAEPDRASSAGPQPGQTTEQIPESAAAPEPQDFLTQYRPALLSFFRRKIGNTTEAEDLTQDVLLRALVHTRWDSPQQARGYIFRIALNRWRDRCRRLRAHGTEIDWDRDLDHELEELGAQNPPDRVLVIQEQLEQVASALDEMNIRTRAVLVLVRIEKMRIAQVAQVLGISSSAVNRHLARGLARLGELRKRQEGL